jgi:hypothetical protein
MANTTNWFYSEVRALDQVEKAITSTYTVKVGTTANNFAVDRVITVTNPSANFTITVPDGVAVGQEIEIWLIANTSAVTVTITVTTGTDYTIATAGYGVHLKWTGVAWIKIVGTVTT